MAEVFSESLNYPDVKKRAVASRSFRVKIPSSNATTFTPTQTINIDLPGNLSGQYYNFNQMYLKFKCVVKGGGANQGLKWDRAGAVSAIKRVQISTAGSSICDLNNYNVLYTALLDTDASVEWKASSGNILTGTTSGLVGEAVDSLTGAEVIAGVSRTYCVPIVLNPLANTTPHRLIPAFSMSALQFKITLDSLAQMGISHASTSIEFQEVEMVCQMTELSPNAQAQVDRMTGGVYNILANSYMNSGATMTAGVSSVTANLGFSVSSLERILLVQRPHINDNTKYTVGNRGSNHLKEYQYLINSENYPQRPIVVSDANAEVGAELLLADHSLTDFRKGNSLQAGVGASTDTFSLQTSLNQDNSVLIYTQRPSPFDLEADDGDTGGTTVAMASNVPQPAVISNIGTFLAGCEFETGLSDGKSQNIYSGISTIASTVQYKGSYVGGAGASQNCTLDFFAQYSVMLSLDMRGSGVWNVSV